MGKVGTTNHNRVGNASQSCCPCPAAARPGPPVSFQLFTLRLSDPGCCSATAGCACAVAPCEQDHVVHSTCQRMGGCLLKLASLRNRRARHGACVCEITRAPWRAALLRKQGRDHQGNQEHQPWLTCSVVFWPSRRHARSLHHSSSHSPC